MTCWKTARLDQCCEIVSGATPSTSITAYWDGDICWATPKDLSDLKGAYISHTPRKITRSGLDSCAATILPTNSVLFSSRAPIGHVAVNTVPMATNQGFKSFVPNPTKVHAKYLYYWLRKNRPYLESLGNGATFKEVSKAIVSRIEIPLPPLPEQRRIAEVLDKAEELRTKRRAALAQLDTLNQSIFLEMFGDIQTIFHKWSVKKLGELLEFLTSGSRGWAQYYSDAGDIFLRIQNVCRDELRLDDVAYVQAPDTAEARRTRVQPGDVLLSITADLGRTAVVPTDIGTAFINQHLSILRTKAIVPRYLSAYLSSPAGQQEVLGRNKHAVKAGLNFDDIRSFRIPMPPLELQRDFARRVAAVEKLKTAHRTSLSELNALFASLQHRAFRGEL
ncbi:restriction endonuclease subunit S [Geobacter sulfurreducens]|uniref:restriction endonuclease subunit S n=1 Tax=Geobacter sulfurreducens TaxID=35554 RepID=UPI001BDD274B|nr:restriction endonuclease subunit S [Geobacter sulfurreducens]QVW35318.1 restriction endonuclease subunit S [Geobacter sulfurreducens]